MNRITQILKLLLHHWSRTSVNWLNIIFSADFVFISRFVHMCVTVMWLLGVSLCVLKCKCMCAYVCVCVCVCVSVCDATVCACVHTCICLLLCVCVCVCMYLWVSACVCYCEYMCECVCHCNSKSVCVEEGGGGRTWRSTWIECKYMNRVQALSVHPFTLHLHIDLLLIISNGLHPMGDWATHTFCESL